MNETITLRNREVFNLPAHRTSPIEPPLYRIGIPLDNEEAQEFREKAFPVFGDEEGPVLAVRCTQTQALSRMWMNGEFDLVVEKVERPVGNLGAVAASTRLVSIEKSQQTVEELA